MVWDKFKNLVHLICELVHARHGAARAATLNGILFHVEFNSWLACAGPLSGVHFFAQEQGPISLELKRALVELEGERLIRREPVRLSELGFDLRHGEPASAADLKSEQSRVKQAAAVKQTCSRKHTAALTNYVHLPDTSDCGLGPDAAADRAAFSATTLSMLHRSIDEFYTLREHYGLGLADLIGGIRQLEYGREVKFAALMDKPGAASIAAYLATDIAHALALTRLQHIQERSTREGGLRTIIEEHHVVTKIDAATNVNPAVRTMYETLLWRLATQQQTPAPLVLAAHTDVQNDAFAAAADPQAKTAAPMSLTHPADSRHSDNVNMQSEVQEMCGSEVPRMPHVRISYLTTRELIIVKNVKVKLPVTGSTAAELRAKQIVEHLPPTGNTQAGQLAAASLLRHAPTYGLTG